MTESSFIIIPLLITFLSVLQIGVGAMNRTIAENSIQGTVARSAMGEPPSGGVELEKVSLPGGGNLIIGRKNLKATSITPLLPDGDNFSIAGYAVEEQ